MREMPIMVEFGPHPHLELHQMRGHKSHGVGSILPDVLGLLSLPSLAAAIYQDGDCSHYYDGQRNQQNNHKK